MPAADEGNAKALLRRVAMRPRLLVQLVLRPIDRLPIRRQLPFWFAILSVTPALIGLITAALLAFTAQLQEVYRAILDDGDVARGLFGLIAVLLLGAVLFCWNRDINRTKIDNVYPRHADLVIDGQLFTIRHLNSLVCALLPLTGLGYGLMTARNTAASEAELFAGVVQRIEGGRFPNIAASADAIAALSPAALIALVVTGVSAVALVWLLWVTRSGQRLGQMVYGLATVAAMIMLVLPFVQRGAPSMAFASAAGPLTMVALVMIGVTAGLIVLSKLSRLLRVPMISLVVLVTLAFTFRSLQQNVSAADPGNDSGARSEGGQEGPSDLTKTFDTWLKARSDRQAYANTGRPYPVFVFAIQGGGIYAASAGGAYLATLQDHCPALTQHIFAVSSVSGGSMGTAVYHAMAAGQRQVGGGAGPECGEPVTVPMAPRLQRVIGGDHLSPLVSLVLSDQLRKLDLLGLQERYGFTDTPNRADALEASFAAAYDRDLLEHPVDDYMMSGISNRLHQRYDLSWGPAHAAPALILNATSVEAGHRVAFSPFPLRSAGDGTLYAFSELSEGSDIKDASLIKAAGVSARIPGIVPAWVVRHQNGNRKQSWTFVDGGYADGSGAETGFDMFRVLEKHIRANKLDVDLRLVLLTNSVAAPRFDDIEGGTFGDAILTVSTLMQIRRLLSVRAVTAAVTEVQHSEPDRYGTPGTDRVFVSHLEHGTFPLSLGWRISPSTDAIVRLLIGRPDLFSTEQCSDLKRVAIGQSTAPGTETELKIARAAETVRTNSCTMQRLIRLVAGR